VAAITLSAQEREALEPMRYAAPPTNPSNRVADDARAAALGQAFFFDTRFSGPLAVASDLGAVGESGRVACATCHDPANGGSDHRSNPPNASTAAGRTGRNAPTVLNAAFQSWQFWDGRKDSLWAQALGPVESPVEHNFSRLEVVHLIAKIPAYRKEFTAIFGSIPAELTDASRFPAKGKPGDAAYEAMTQADKAVVNAIYAGFGKAIEAYERKLVGGDSAFDTYMAGDVTAMSESAVRGAKLFVGAASCNTCHAGPNFTDDKFHNIGVKQEGLSIGETDLGRAKGADQCKEDLFNRAGAFSDAKNGQHLDGLSVTNVMIGAFRTPSLRNLAHSAPYMHTGSLGTLADVVRFYAEGGATEGFSGSKDPLVKKLDLTEAEQRDVVAFMDALTSKALPRDLVTAPVLPAL
jgi:cytochrome c peroxidase